MPGLPATRACLDAPARRALWTRPRPSRPAGRRACMDADLAAGRPWSCAAVEVVAARGAAGAVDDVTSGLCWQHARRAAPRSTTLAAGRPGGAGVAGCSTTEGGRAWLTRGGARGPDDVDLEWFSAVRARPSRCTAGRCRLYVVVTR